MTESGTNSQTALHRCPWAERSPLETVYHDTAWGKPCRDADLLFEYLILDTFQAGLSWAIVLKKREGFRQAFRQFDPGYMAALSDADLARLAQDPAIIRNKLKLAGARRNAQAYMALEGRLPGGLSGFLWGFVAGEPIVNHWTHPGQVPARTPLSDTVSKALLREGFCFCGSVTTYAFMQAIGMVNDHLVSCPCHPYNQP